jgi:hypothetical protein
VLVFAPRWCRFGLPLPAGTTTEPFFEEIFRFVEENVQHLRNSFSELQITVLSPARAGSGRKSRVLNDL